MARRSILVTVAFAVLLASVSVAAQTFDVASIKRRGSPETSFSDPSSMPHLRPLPGGRLSVGNADLRSLIQWAYGVQDRSWIVGNDPQLEQRFDIEARAANDAEIPRGTVVGPINRMLQALLGERFKLAVRWDNRDEQVYVLLRAREDGKLGRGLRPTECPSPSANPVADATAAAIRPGTKQRCGNSTTTNGVMQASGLSMSELARGLSMFVQRPVLDRTGLAGRFDIDTMFNMADLPSFAGRSRDGGSSSDYPSFNTAFRDDLGLKLERRRERVPVLIVEHVEPLIEN